MNNHDDHDDDQAAFFCGNDDVSERFGGMENAERDRLLEVAMDHYCDDVVQDCQPYETSPADREKALRAVRKLYRGGWGSSEIQARVHACVLAAKSAGAISILVEMDEITRR